MVSRMRRRRSSTFQKENYRRLTAQGIGAQYHSPVIALADHMVKRSGQFHSWLSRHRSDKTAPIKQNESLTPPPPSGSTIPPGTLQNPVIIPRARSNMRICPPRMTYTPAANRYCFVQSRSAPSCCPSLLLCCLLRHNAVCSLFMPPHDVQELRTASSRCVDTQVFLHGDLIDVEVQGLQRVERNPHHGFRLLGDHLSLPARHGEIVELPEFLRAIQEGTDVGYLDRDNPDFLLHFTIQRLFRALACLYVPAWQGNGPRHHPFGALALLSEDLTVFYEHKGNTLDRTHIIHHRRTPDILWH